jgi:hypothetical protein
LAGPGASVRLARSDPCQSGCLLRQFGCSFRVGCGEVSHGRLLGDAEQTHELEGIGGLERLVEDPVLAYWP